MKLIIDRLREHNLCVKVSKCKIAKTKIEFLSHVVSNGTVSPSPGKVQAIYQFDIPTNIKQVQSFLGLASYYRKFITNFSSIASPLIRCTMKNKTFEWNLECQSAFDRLRIILTSNNILTLPDFNKPFRLETDACNYGIGAVLSQEVDGHFKPIAYYSRHLSRREQNYSTSERELLAIVFAVEHFRQFLYGTDFAVLTDHQPLRHLLTTEEPAPRLARWINRLRQYRFHIEYRKGIANGNADALSRLALISRDIDDDGENSSTTDTINLIRLATNQLNNNQLEDENIKWIYKLKMEAKESNLKRIFTDDVDNVEKKSYYIQWERIRVSGKNVYREWIDEDGTIRFQFIVPKSNRAWVMEQAHNSMFSGHLGYEKTLERIRMRV